MSQSSRQEVFKTARLRYCESSRREKSILLDELVLLTGLHRKHAIVLLGIPQDGLKGAIRRSRKKLYSDEARKALVSLWEYSNRLCSKRLAPYMKTFCEAIEKHGHLELTAAVRTEVLTMSPATIDRYLAPLRDAEHQQKRRAKHRAPEIRKQIPIKTFTEWENTSPGHCEIDLVAHCGTSMGGVFLYSFVLTDIATGWTESLPIGTRDQETIIAALDRVRLQFPFPILSLDSDNGSEFINSSLIAYCKKHSLIFTRSRPYKKNDQCYIEQKNGQIVRRNVGYDRLEGPQAFDSLNELYKVLRLYTNCFQPSQKLLEKSRNGAKTTRKYDSAQTPYQRVMSSTSITEAVKSELKALYERLDPVSLLQALQGCQDKLWCCSAQIPVSIEEKISGSLVKLDYHATTLTYKKEENQQGVRHWKKTKRIYKKATQPRWWRSRKDDFELAWPTIENWLNINPSQTARSILEKLEEGFPGQFSIKNKRTLHRRIQAWRKSRPPELSWGPESLNVIPINICGIQNDSSVTTIAG